MRWSCTRRSAAGSSQTRRMGEAREPRHKNPDAKRAQPIRQRWRQCFGCLMGYARWMAVFFPGSCRASPILRRRNRRMGEAREPRHKNPDAKRAQPIRQRWRQCFGCLMGYARWMAVFFPGSCRASPILRRRNRRMGEARETRHKNPDAQRAQPIRQRWRQCFGCLMGYARWMAVFFPGSCRASPILRRRNRRMGEARETRHKNPDAQRAQPIRQRWRQCFGCLMGYARWMAVFFPGSCRASPILRRRNRRMGEARETRHKNPDAQRAQPINPQRRFTPCRRDKRSGARPRGCALRAAPGPRRPAPCGRVPARCGKSPYRLWQRSRSGNGSR